MQLTFTIENWYFVWVSSLRKILGKSCIFLDHNVAKLFLCLKSCLFVYFCNFTGHYPNIKKTNKSFKDWIISSLQNIGEKLHFLGPQRSQSLFMLEIMFICILLQFYRTLPQYKKNEGFKNWIISCKVVEVYTMDHQWCHRESPPGKTPRRVYSFCGAFHLERHLIFHFTSFEGSFQVKCCEGSFQGGLSLWHYWRSIV